MPSPPAVPTVDHLICAALRGEAPDWPWPDEAAKSTVLLDRVAFHGVGALLHSRVDPIDWPVGVLQALRNQALQQAMWELRDQQLLTQALAALVEDGIQPVLIKGAALAYSLYADPALRARGDTDLIIPPAARAHTHEILVSLGYQRALGVSGEFVSYQSNYTKQADGVGTHALDLHWKINNSEVLSRLFTYEELRRDALSLPTLGTHALGPSLIHSLLIACMHRATHRTHPYYVGGRTHYDPDRVIWLTDIHLIAGRLSTDQWAALVAQAGEKGLRPIVCESLNRAQSCWHTPCAEFVLRALAQPAAAQTASTYLAAGSLRQHLMDFLAIRGVARKLEFLRELVFPAPEYMRARFGGSPGFLPWLYLRRAAGGLIKRIGVKSH